MITDKELLDFIDGNLSDAESEELKRIIDEHPEIKRRYEELSIVDNALTDQPLAQPSSNFAESVMSNLGKKVASAPLAYNGFWKKNLFVVITIVAIGLIAGMVLLSNSSLTDILPTIEPREITVSERTISIDPGKLNFINQDLFFKGLIYLNAFLALYLLDRTVLKPYFRNRRQSYSF
jgi:hypothetical protein